MEKHSGSECTQPQKKLSKEVMLDMLCYLTMEQPLIKSKKSF